MIDENVDFPFMGSKRRTLTLMLARHPVFWHVCVDHRAGLQEELP